MWIPNIEAAGGPIYLAIADALEADIKTGALAQGDRLPPQRELAYQLGVTLGTITRAYGEAERRRLVKGETGRGTYIASETQKVSPLTPKEDEPETCDLARNFAYPHLNPSLSDGLTRMARTVGIDRLNGFVPSEGLKAHRETGALVFKDYGLEADPDRVAVTCGAQHGIQVTCQALFRPGDAVAVDRFTYPSIFSSFASIGLKPVPLPALIRADGGFGAMDPAALAQAAKTHGVKGVFLMPNMQNPTTHTMSVEERQDLVAVARQFDLKIVEDDPYTPFLPDALPAFGALAPERTASIASISKVCSPGSRIGFVHVPGPFGDSIRNKIGESTWMASPITAELACQWIESGVAAELQKSDRQEIEARAQLLAPLRKHYQLECHAGSPHGWLHLPERLCAETVAEELKQDGVLVKPASDFVVNPEQPCNAIRFSLTAPLSRSELAEGLTRIEARLTRSAVAV